MSNEQNRNDFSGLIELVKTVATDEEYKGIAVKNYNNWVYGEVTNGLIKEPHPLNVVNQENLCQDLYDALTTEFGNQLESSCSHSFDGNWNYFMKFAGKVAIFFPDSYEFSTWSYNQHQKDRGNSINSNKPSTFGDENKRKK